MDQDPRRQKRLHSKIVVTDAAPTGLTPQMADVSSETEIHAYVQGSLQGDENAARELFRFLHPLVARVVRARLPKRESEEDLIQTVFIRIFSNLKQYSGKVPIEHWASRIAVNTCLKQLRFESHRPEVRWSDLGEERQRILEGAAPDVADVRSSFGARELVEKMLLCMKPAQRMLMNWFALEGKSIEEISRMTGWSKANVKVRLFRARRELRSHYARLMKEKS